MLKKNVNKTTKTKLIKKKENKFAEGKEKNHSFLFMKYY